MSKNKKYWKRRFGNFVDNIEPYQHHFDLRRIDDLDDEGFAYLIEHVKGVNMLDLNETEITDKSISLLTGLEYVTELRAKENYGLTDDCADDLNKIKGLELLHVRSTGITIDGLLKLKDQHQLKKILFSADDVEAIKEKLLQLKTILPNCELLINAKPYHVDAVELFVYSINKKPYTYRLKIKNEPLDAEWSNWLIHPTESYIEVQVQGPYSIDDLEWVEIDAIEKRYIGKLVPEKEFDHSATIIKLLDYLSFPYKQSGQVFSVYLVKRKI